MAKSKKTDSEKATKDGKKKKGKKKDKAVKEILSAKPAKPAKKVVEPQAKPKAKPAAAPATVITNDDISMRAYFIAERRQAMGWPGDSSSDWTEAERQLKAEARRKSGK